MYRLAIVFLLFSFWRSICIEEWPIDREANYVGIDNYLERVDIVEKICIVGKESAKVKVEVKFPVDVNPPIYYNYSTIKSGKKYSGLLSLESIRKRKDANYATYVGNIYPEE